MLERSARSYRLLGCKRTFTKSQSSASGPIWRSAASICSAVPPARLTTSKSSAQRCCRLAVTSMLLVSVPETGEWGLSMSALASGYRSVAVVDNIDAMTAWLTITTATSTNSAGKYTYRSGVYLRMSSTRLTIRDRGRACGVTCDSADVASADADVSAQTSMTSRCTASKNTIRER